MNYSDQIKTIRDNLLMTQTELAEMLGVTFATVPRQDEKRTFPKLIQEHP